jgi:hypothetical protein
MIHFFLSTLIIIGYSNVRNIFFYSADLPTRCARAANFPSRKKNYYFTHLLHK